MTILSLILIILSNSVSSRKDLAILFSRSVFTTYFLPCYLIINAFNYLYNSCDTGIGLYGGLFFVSPITYTMHAIFLIRSLMVILIAIFPSIVINFNCSISKNNFFKDINNHINNKLSNLDISKIISTIDNLLINTKFNLFLFILGMYINSLLICSLIIVSQIILLLRFFIQSSFITRNLDKKTIDSLSLILCCLQLLIFLLILILFIYHLLNLLYILINNVLKMNKKVKGDEGANNSNNSPSSSNNSPNGGNGKGGPSTSYPESRKRKREDYEDTEDLDPGSPSKKIKEDDNEAQNASSSNDRDPGYESNFENYNASEEDNNNDNQQANSHDNQEASSHDNQEARSDDNQSSSGAESEAIPDTPSTIGDIPDHNFNRINITPEEEERLEDLYQRVQRARNDIIDIKNDVPVRSERLTSNLNYKYGRLDEIAREIRDEETHLYKWQTPEEEAIATNINLNSVKACRAEANNAIDTLEWELYYIERHLRFIIESINGNN